MRKSFLIFSFFFLSVVIHAQSVTEDSVTAESAFKWVERKLTFNYFDPTNQNWWVNRLHRNDDGSVTLINIAAEHPDKVLEKVYHLRRFFLYDINPIATTVVEIPKDQGRFVKGRIVRLQGFGDENKISTKKDGRVGSDVSFIHISVPQFLEDSLQNYAFELKGRIQELLSLEARLLNVGDTEKNQAAVLSAWRGNFVNKDSTHYLSMTVEDPGLIRFEWKMENGRRFGQFGYDSARKTFYFFSSSNKEYYMGDFTTDSESNDLILKNGNDTIHIVGRNTIEINVGGIHQRFLRY
jgi:hypothetical protein